MSHILNPLEQDILRAFFSLEKSKAFVLTGGAALAEFYFQHRLSNDLDLFTLDEQAFTEVGSQTGKLAQVVGADEKPIRSLATLNQVTYARGEEEVKVDFVRDSGPTFGQPLEKDQLRIDALENIGANKVLALFGRAAFRDYIDLYFILHEGGLTFHHLLALAKQKDLGLQEFYLANWIRQQTPRLQSPPKMLKTIDLEEVKSYFLKLADDLMAGLNPEKHS
jgi:predicted nucleotidyltransferase component of viral defense system